MHRLGLILLLLCGFAVAQNGVIEYAPDEVFILSLNIAAREDIIRAELEIELLNSERVRLERLLGQLDVASDEEAREQIVGYLDRATTRAEENLERVQERKDAIQARVDEIGDRYGVEQR